MLFELEKIVIKLLVIFFSMLKSKINKSGS